MNCPQWEERLALYAEGDLDAAEAGRVEEHLAGCAGCREFTAGLRRSLTLLRGAHADPLAPAHYTAVRTRVLDRLRWRRRAWVLGWASAVAAAAAVLALLFLPKPQSIEPPRVALIRPPAPAVVETESPAAPHRHKRRFRRPRAVLEAPAEPLVVQLQTDDPEVVIYWIVDGKGD